MYRGVCSHFLMQYLYSSGKQQQKHTQDKLQFNSHNVAQSDHLCIVMHSAGRHTSKHCYVYDNDHKYWYDNMVFEIPYIVWLIYEILLWFGGGQEAISYTIQFPPTSIEGVNFYLDHFNLISCYTAHQPKKFQTFK